MFKINNNDLVRLPARTLGCHKRWKSLSFCEIRKNLTHHLLLIRPPKNKHCRAWTSAINLWVDSRASQRYRTLRSARQRSNNYLEFSKKKMFLAKWCCHIDHASLTMMQFQKIFKLIFQKQPSCPRNKYICYQHWRKPPIFTAFLETFLYLKNIDSVEHL